VGRAIVTVEGIRRLALGGALPFVDAATATAAQLSDAPRTVAQADADPDVTLEVGSVFLRLMDLGADSSANAQSQVNRTEVVVLASPAVPTATPRAASQPTNTPVPPRDPDPDAARRSGRRDGHASVGHVPDRHAAVHAAGLAAVDAAGRPEHADSGADPGSPANRDPDEHGDPHCDRARRCP
jgi:hypothetical protein